MPKFHGLDTSGLSIGQIIMLSHNDVLPFGTLPCLGAQVSRTSYAALFKRIGTTWGNGDGATTFHTPSVSGQFPRFSDALSTSDVDSYARSGLIAGTFTLATCSTTSGSAVVTVPSTVNLSIGKSVTGTGIPLGSTVLSILSGTTFQLGNQTGTAPATATATNASTNLTFSISVSGPFAGTYQADVFGSHTHTDSGHYHTAYGGGSFVLDHIGGTLSVGSGPFVTTSANNITNNASASLANSGGTETRPKNVALRAAIAYI